MTDIFVKIGATEYDASKITLPHTRTFRDAWAVNSGENIVSIDMQKARDIWRDKIRLARKPELEALDAQFMRALEAGADTSAIVAQKQALRDAPADPAIDAAQTPEQLKQVHPAGLIIE